MATASFWDLYYDRAKQFSAETREHVYNEYQTELAERFKTNTPISRDASLEERLRSRWNGVIAKEFYVRAAQIHDKVAFDFQILASLINNKALFDRLPIALQKRIQYYYDDYATLLLDEASIPNNRCDVEAYQKALGIYPSVVKPIEKPTKAAANSQKSSFSDTISKWFKAWFSLYPETVIFGFAFSNAYRLLTRFFILAWLEIWSIGRQQGWLDKFDKLAGILPIDTYLLESTTPVFNVLSLVLFFGRFVVDFGKLIQRVFWPTEDEKGVNYMERARIEARKRYLRSVNDVLWTLFNLLTNYAAQLGIPLPIAGWLLTGFLMFDVYWYWHKWGQAEKAIVAKESWLASHSANQSDVAVSMVQIELRQLACRRAQNRGEFLFCLAAAALLVASFTVLLAFYSSPFAPIACFLSCNIAIAMYINTEQFAAGVRASYERQLDETKYDLKDLQKDSDYNQVKIKAEHAAWKKFGKDFAETLIIPSLLIGLYTINWPAAVALTVAYVAFKIMMKNESAKAFVHKNVEAVVGCFWSKESKEASKGESRVPLLEVGSVYAQ